jgi:hypothetical protein
MESDLNLIRTTLTDFHIIVSFSFCLIMAFFGQVSPIVKGESHFRLGEFVVSFCTSVLAGVTAFFLLKATSCPDQAIAGISGLCAYFGNRSLTTMYAVLCELAKRLGGKNE